MHRDNLNRLSSVTDNQLNGATTYSYDAAMNGGAVRLVNDGDGNRVSKTVNGVTTRYLVDDLNPTGYAQVVEETGATTRTYTYGLQRISKNQIVNRAMMPSFYGYDGMGSVRHLSGHSLSRLSECRLESPQQFR